MMWGPQNHIPCQKQAKYKLPIIPLDNAFLTSPADVPGLRRVDLQDADITPGMRSAFDMLCEKYPKVFSKGNEEIGTTQLVTMDIDMGDSPPVSSRPYTLALKHYRWVQEEIETLERAGVITKSMSPWASPIVIVPKKSQPGEPPRRDYNNNLFNIYTYSDRPYILIFNFIILYNTHIYVRVTLSQRAVSETDRVPFILTILFALHLH